MRTLHVIPSLAESDGGPSKAALEMCRELTRRSHNAEIYTTNATAQSRSDVLLGQPLSVHGVNVTYFPINGGTYYKYSYSMAAALKATIPRYDIVHIHSLYQFPSTAAAHYCRKYRVPYILRPHGTLDPFLYKRHPLRKRIYELMIERRNLAAAAAVHFTSEEELRLATRSGLDFKGAVVPLGVELDDPLPCAARAADSLWPELRGKRVILFLSRINFKKGLDILAAAFGEVHKVRADAHLVIAGPDIDGYGTKVREWLTAAAALEAATFTGMVLDTRKAALLSRADLFVLPSYSENFGIAVVEAMGAGLPIVISNRVNIWREIDAAHAGFVVTPDARELATAILALLDNPGMARSMGERGHRLAREQFSWRAAGDHLEHLYGQLICKHPATPPR
jgi:glycosyltransferase involved in cell wall biosynthesis